MCRRADNYINNLVYRECQLTTRNLKLKRVYGYWTVLKYIDSMHVSCRCQCGQERVLQHGNLLRSVPKSCGCKRGIDLKGKKFGFWHVIKKSKRGGMWVCRCVCGTKREMASTPLLTGNSKSCGCRAAKLQPKTPGTILQRRILANYKGMARARGFDFDLSPTTLFGFISQPCYYCGSSAQNKIHDKKHHKIRRFNGIDRVDSTVGYAQGNVVTCCKTCNFAKGKMPIYRFEKYIKRLHDYICTNVEDSLVRKSKKIRAERQALSWYMRRARKKKIPFLLDTENFFDIINSRCHYCGRKPKKYTVVPKGYYSPIRMGLDRIDNRKGYVPDNVVPCCKYCNSAKRAMSYDQFLDWIDRVYNNFILNPEKIKRVLGSTKMSVLDDQK